jgi:hypothetical protein
MPKIDLLPCLFCGKRDTAKCITVAECLCIDEPTKWEKTHYIVSCDASIAGGCGASTGWSYETPEEAAKAWNTRASGWIPCSERMPENADDPGAFCPKYYVKTRYGVTEGWYNPDFDVWFVLIWYYTRRFLDHEISLERGDVPKVCAMMKSDVTHWMPLPAPPETEGKA